jgi:hypothetical protein
MKMPPLPVGLSPEGTGARGIGVVWITGAGVETPTMGDGLGVGFAFWAPAGDCGCCIAGGVTGTIAPASTVAVAAAATAVALESDANTGALVGTTIVAGSSCATCKMSW